MNNTITILCNFIFAIMLISSEVSNTVLSVEDTEFVVCKLYSHIEVGRESLYLPI